MRSKSTARRFGKGAESISPDAGIQDNSELSDLDPSPGMPEDDFYNIPSVLLGGRTEALPNRNSGSGASPNRTETENPVAGYNVFQIPKPTGSEAASNRNSASGSGVLPNRSQAEKLSQKFRPLFNAASNVEFFSDETKITAKNEELITKEIYRNNCDVKDVHDVENVKNTCAVKTGDIRDKVVYKSYVRDCDIEIKRLPGNTGIGVWTRVSIEAGHTIGPCVVNNRGGISQLNARDFEKSEWMTLIRPVTNTEASNLMAVQLQNQLYYRAIREIQAGEEMLLYTKDRLYPQKEMDFDKVDSDLNSATCVNCGEVFQTKSALQAHQTYACQPTSPSYTEKDADSTEHGSFRSGDGIHSPVEECDPQDSGEFKCEECPRSFALKSNLARHQITHESGRRFACEHCDRCFTDPSNLQRHIRSQHHGARCHACVDCGKTFATSSGLKQHQHIHSSVKPFQCEVCLKAYTQFSNLCRHKRMHADCRQQIKCTDCGQAFSTITSLSKHKRFCEGALRSGMRLGGYGGDSKLSQLSPGAAGLQHAGPTTPFSPALMMGLYGARPPFPFYQPMGSNFAGMFPAGHPLAALTALSPGSMRSSAFSFTPTKTESSSPSKFEGSSGMSRPSEGLSDGASEVQSGSDLDNIPSDSESEHSYERKSVESKSIESKIGENKPEIDIKSEIDIVKSKTPELSHSVPAILSQPHPNRFTPHSSPGVLNLKTSPPSLTKEEPFDLSKTYKTDQITPKTSPAIETTTSGEQPLDLSSAKDLTPPEAPRKTHIFGDPKTPDTPGQRLHYAYPQLTSSMMMEQALRMSEKKEKSPESTGFLPYTRFPFTSPSQYPMGVNPFSLVMNREPVKPVQPPQFSPVGKSPVSPYQYTSPSQYSSLSSSHSSPNKTAKDKYSCKFCGKVFPRSANLTRHLRTHTGEQPYKCKYCERSFSISSNLQRHVRNIHNKEKPFRCALCDRCFGQQTNLDRHLKKHETDGMNLPDSPENETESTELDDKDESYFAEIRNFIGKATERGLTDINQNSLALSEMKARLVDRMGQMSDPRVDSSFEDENEQELDVGGPGDLNETGTDGSENGDIENDIDGDKGEPATKRSRLADQLLMNSFTQDTALPLCKTPSFELERNFTL